MESLLQVHPKHTQGLIETHPQVHPHSLIESHYELLFINFLTNQASYSKLDRNSRLIWSISLDAAFVLTLTVIILLEVSNGNDNSATSLSLLGLVNVNCPDALDASCGANLSVLGCTCE